METKVIRIDLVKLVKYMLRRILLILICAGLGFGVAYIYSIRTIPIRYSTTGTLYISNGNPNLEEYRYINKTDLDVVPSLTNTYLTVIRSKTVMNNVTKKLQEKYPDITIESIMESIYVSGVEDSGIIAVTAKSSDPQIAADITNAILDEAPSQILRVVGGGRISVVDYALVPLYPESRAGRRAIFGGILGAALGIGILLILFLTNHRITQLRDLKEYYTPPVLASLKRVKDKRKSCNSYLITSQSTLEEVERYSKLCMNLTRVLEERKTNTIAVTSAVSGEGKSTIAANLAITAAADGMRVLLIDADLRRGCQKDLLGYDPNAEGLSDILTNGIRWESVLIKKTEKIPDILPAGQLRDNPIELLKSERMKELLGKLKTWYDLIILDTPSVNVVTDPLVLAKHGVGSIMVVRQNYTDHRELRKALIEAYMAGFEVLGFVYFGEKLHEDGFQSKRLYKRYYNNEAYQRIEN